MISIFRKSGDTELESWILEACSIIGVAREQVQFFDLETSGLRAREYGRIVYDSEAVIIDVDVMNLISYAVEFGSIGSGFSFVAYSVDPHAAQSPTGQETVRPADPDAKVMLFTRQQGDGPRGSPVLDHFGKYYSSVSGKEGMSRASAVELSKWIRSTVDASKPRVFLSYRSRNLAFAERVARSLKRRGAYVWFDAWNVLPGDSIPQVINQGLVWATHLVILIDDTFHASNWTNMELDSFLYGYLAGPDQLPGHVKEVARPIIPVYMENAKKSSLPLAIQRLRGVLHAGTSFRSAMGQLWRAISS